MIAPSWQAKFMAAFRQSTAQVQLRDASGRLDLKKLPAWAWGIGALALCGLLLLAVDLLNAPRGELPKNLSGGGLPGSSLLDTSGLALEVLLKLGLVLGLMVASLSLLNRWRGAIPAGRSREINRLESLRLSPRQALHLVEVRGQVYLIGATDQAMSLLAEVDEAGPTAGKPDSGAQAPASFFSTLQLEMQPPGAAQDE